MAENTLATVDVPCSLFGGLDTELSPPDLPEGVSPDNQDVAFLPGNVEPRPTLARQLSKPLHIAGLTYIKSFVQPNQDPLTLILNSAGELWQEDVANNPGQLTTISTAGTANVPGNYAQSVTQFGREYIAFSNALTGIDVPRKWDGTTYSRVTQDGPGTLNLSVTTQQQTKTIVNIVPAIGTLTIATVTEYNGLVTVVTTAPHGLFVNDQVIVYCLDTIFSNQGNPILIQQVNSPTSFSYTIGVTGIPGVTGGDVYPLKVLLTTSTPHGLVLGDNFTVTGNSWPLYNSATTYPTGATPITQYLTFSQSGKPPINTFIPFNNQPQELTVNFAANFAGSSGSVVDNPTDPLDFGISADGPYGLRTLGSVLITTGGAVSFTSIGGAAQVLYAGETLYIYTSEASQDATLQGLSVTLVGNTVATATTPPQWTVTEVPSLTTVNFNAVSNNEATGTGGTMIVGGQLAAGERKVAVFLETFDGEQTNPSPPITFSSQQGSRVTITGLPTVYTNIKTINFAFTLAGGNNFFYIPITPTGSSIYGNQQAIGTSTVVAPGTGVATFDFSDITLAAASAIDILGNNLFAQSKLPPCLGFFAYASRLFAWGMWNTVDNLMNMGFDGGYDPTSGIATGWTNSSAAGQPAFTFTAGPDDYTPGVCRCTTSGTYSMYQGAYQDAYGIAILQPQTAYTIRFRAFVANPSLGGTLRFSLESPTVGNLAGADLVFQLSNMVTNGGIAPGAWLQTDFTAQTPNEIPADAIFSIQAIIPSGQTLEFDETMLIYTQTPIFDAAMVSYIENPGGFDGVTGVLGTTNDTSPFMCFSTLRDFLYFKTSAGFYRTIDNGSEPSFWSVSTVSQRVGAVSFRAGDAGQYGTGDTGEGWDFTLARSGLYIFGGGELFKVSQEIQTIIDGINWAYQQTIWLKNDTVTRRVYIGVPYQGATAPNIVLVMDYRELDLASQIGSDGPVHISFTGKMISSDLTRKWTIWNTPMNCGELIERPGNQIEFCMGSGNGVTPGQQPAYGNFYALDTHGYTGGGTVTITPLATNLANPWPILQPINFPAQLNQDLEWPLNVSTERCAFKIALTNLGPGDDDYGPVLPYYTTYFFLNHEAEIALGTGAHVKLFCYLAAFINGYGSIQKLIVSIRQHPMYPVRGYL